MTWTPSFEVVMGNSQGVGRYDVDITPALLDQAGAALDAGETDFCVLIAGSPEPVALTLPIQETLELIQERLDKAHIPDEEH